MKTKLQLLFIGLAMFAGIHQAAAQGTAFTYQGRLSNGTNAANGSYDLSFALFKVASGGSAVAGPLTNSATGVSNGLFIVTLDFGNVFNGTEYWLEIGVRTNGNGTFITLTPRQAVTPTPYAIFAEGASNVVGVVPGGGLSGTYSHAVSFNNAGNNFDGSFSGNGSGLTGVNAATLNGLGAGSFWQTGGNLGTTAGVNYLGTTDNQPLEFHVNGTRTLRMEPGGPSGGVGNGVPTGAPNMIGGAVVNYVSNSVVGATISGGGTTNYGGAAYSNSITADFGTVAGGLANSASFQFATVGGGVANISSNFAATVPGGYRNTAGGYAATVAGGFHNTANGTGSFVGGGGYEGSTVAGNQASGAASVVGGGEGNTASGAGSFVGGGGYDGSTIAENQASGAASVVGGGLGNQALNVYGTVGGGYQNTASGVGAFVGGGGSDGVGTGGNQAGGGASVVCGGEDNTASVYEATVGGGIENTASGIDATVPGGLDNLASGYASFAAGDSAEAQHQGAFVWADSQGSSYSSDRNNQFKIRAGGGMVLDVSGSSGLNPAALRISSTSANGVGIFVAQNSSDATAVFTAAGTGDVIKGFNGDNGGNPVFEVDNNGNVSAQGYYPLSDRNAKEHFTTVSPAEMLEKVASLPISQWNYKTDPADHKHVGPMAQDFHTAFGLNGAEDKRISLTDEGGVALAAIQGLNQKLDEKDVEIQTLRQQNDALAQRLNELEATVKQLAAQK